MIDFSKQINAGLVTNFEVFSQLNTRKGTSDMGTVIMDFKSKVIITFHIVVYFLYLMDLFNLFIYLFRSFYITRQV